MSKFKAFFVTLLIWAIAIPGFSLETKGIPSRHFPSGTQDVYIGKAEGVRSSLLTGITPIIEKSIAKGYYPGAVVLVGHDNQIIYKGVFGNKSIVPNVSPMKFDTIFDIASLTKVVATAPAIMQLVEQGKLDVNAPVAKYWPRFGEEGKNKVTVRELLTHTSGLPAELSNYSNANSQEILNKICKLKLSHQTGKFLYSDVNFIVLAHLVEIISHEPFDKYVQNHIFDLLNMKNTFYAPAQSLRDQIAPTEVMDNQLRWGKVHDPFAYSQGGIAGNAGLFSNAHDLSLYISALLNNGILPKELQTSSQDSKQFLGPQAITKMTTPQTPNNLKDVRGLGWDINSRYSNRTMLFPTQSYGHTGWTGTSIWIDPSTKTWIIILTSRTHPTPTKKNKLIEDRRLVANIVFASIQKGSNYSSNPTSKDKLNRA